MADELSEDLLVTKAVRKSIEDEQTSFGHRCASEFERLSFRQCSQPTQPPEGWPGSRGPCGPETAWEGLNSLDWPRAQAGSGYSSCSSYSGHDPGHAYTNPRAELAIHE